MSKLLNQEEFTQEFEKLIADGMHPLDVRNIAIKAGQGVLSRGTIISKNATGDFVVCGSAGTGLTAKYVLADEVDTGSAAGDAVTGTVYRSGSMRLSGLIVASGYTLAETDIESLEQTGIYVK